jgi:hypothetical protein
MKRVYLDLRHPLDDEVEPDIQALQLLQPSKDLRVIIRFDCVYDTSDLRDFCELFKPVHKHLLRGMAQGEFMELRAKYIADSHSNNYNTYGVKTREFEKYPPGLPYMLSTGEESYDQELNNYFWSESPEDEEAFWRIVKKQTGEVRYLFQSGA